MRPPALWRLSVFRHAALYTAAFTAATALALLILYVSTIGLVERQTRTTIEAETRGLSEQFRAGGLARLARSLQARADIRPPTGALYLLADPNGTPAAGNLSAWPESAPPAGVFELPIIRRGEAGEITRRAIAESFTLPGGYRLLVGRDAEELAQTRRLFLTAGLWIGLGAMLLGLATGLLLSRRVLARVAAAAEAGERIAGGALESRLPTSGTGDEFDRLAGSVNALMDRIEALMASMSAATDSISHDLRRPLTRLRAKLELAASEAPGPLAGQLGAAIEDVDRTTAILAGLLRIAQAEAGASAGFAPVDLAALARDAAELYAPLAEDQGRRITLEAAPLSLPGERQLLAQALGNLLDNALRYGAGEIRLALSPGAGGAVITVTDEGPGIPAGDLAAATGRFTRLDPSRNAEGAGLGLALVKAVAELHGGRLELGPAQPPSAPAPGLMARIHLAQRTVR